ncbi:MAG: helix-turn-helix transcriptional regulator [Erysipelotrichaceae bacterium]|nr:helix-turn-helix transcriptional regulator [Erysipelotrichaceae bacterium]
MKTLGTKISEYRKLKGMTQEDLALQMNVSSQAVSKWENDLSIPDLPVLIQLADLFHVTLDELVRNQEPMTMVVAESLRKPVEQMVFRVIVNSKEGDRIRVNLPMLLVKAGIEIGMSMPEVNGKEALKGIDFEQLIKLVDQGLVGKLVEVQSADGDLVEVYVE